MLLLALDTATPAVTVALHDGDRVIAELTTVDARRQGELLASSVAKVMRVAGAEMGDLSVVVAGAGPGPYTGLRAGLVTARVLGSALQIPAHGVCTLDVIAVGAVAAAAGREFLVATDARRRELYWARYSPAGERLSGPAVAAPAALPAGLPVAGEGARAYPDVLGDPIEPRYPSAATLACFASEWLARGDSLLPPEPLYLRRPDARVPGPPKPVSPGRGPAGQGRDSGAAADRARPVTEGAAPGRGSAAPGRGSAVPGRSNSPPARDRAAPAALDEVAAP